MLRWDVCQRDFLLEREKKVKKIVAFAMIVLLCVSAVPVTETGAKEPVKMEEREVTEGTEQEQSVKETELLEGSDQNSYVSENDQEEVGELKENSFRYKDGVPVEFPEVMSRGLAYSKENGICYNGRGEPVPGAVGKGIDVSEHNGVIDWEAVKNSDVDYAIIRVGYGSNYTQYDDDYWTRNAQECTRLGIPFGVYIYSYADSVEDAASEADHVLRLISGYNLSYPVYYDLEETNIINKVGKGTITEIAKTFCGRMQNAGYEVGVYANLNWWNNYLTDGVFNNWHRWVAQYNVTCDYGGKYHMWQCTSSASVPGINGNVDVNFFYEELRDAEGFVAIPIEVKNIDILRYNAFVDGKGWTEEKKNGVGVGSIGQNRAMKAIKLTVDKENLGITYSAHISNMGWTDYVADGQMIGAENSHNNLEALRISLTGTAASDYDIYYRVHVANLGWLEWAKNGQAAGTEGYGYQVEAVQVAILEKDENVPGKNGEAFKVKGTGVQYGAYVQGQGWYDLVANGSTAGTEGQSLALEGIKITLKDSEYEGGISYSAKELNGAWIGIENDGNALGKEGEPIEAIKVELTGQIADVYSVYYRVHVQDYGWLDWGCDGQLAGSCGANKQIEAIQIQLVKDGQAAPGMTDEVYKNYGMGIDYSVVTQDGAQVSGKDGVKISGENGLSAIRGVQIRPYNNPYDGYVSYMAVLSDGTETEWRNADVMTEETEIEALRIKLEGELEDYYNIFYRVRIEEFGWLDWTSNGNITGTKRYGYPIQGIQIILLDKNDKGIEEGESPYLEAKAELTYSTHVQDLGWQEYKKEGEISGTEGLGLRLEALKISLNHPEYEGGIEYSTHIQNIGWQEYKKANELSGTEGQRLQLEAVKIRLTGELARHYDVYYRVHAANFGWLDWASNETIAGTINYEFQLEAIEIQMVPKGEPAPGKMDNPYRVHKAEIMYSTHVQDLGWLDYVKSGISGTEGRSLRVEAMRVQLYRPEYEGSIEYSVHVQDLGWLDYVKDNELAGTVGRNLQMEALKIRLTGEMENYYNIYYRVHIADYGWLDWTLNGEPAGSQGLRKKVEAVEIKLIPKNEEGVKTGDNAFVSAK